MRRALEYRVKPHFKCLEDTASAHPDRVGFSVPGVGDYTFGEVKAWVDGLAALLAREGVSKGDRVVLFSSNCLEFVISFFAIQKAGGVVVPLNPLLTDPEVKKYLDIASPSGVVAQRDVYEKFPSLGEIDGPRYLYDPGSGELMEMIEASSPGGEVHLPAINVFEDLAVMPFSSGTTGLPKAVMLTHANLYCNLQQIVDAHELTPNDVYVNHLPFFHIYGMNVLLSSAVFLGARQVILSGFEPEAICSAVEKYGGTLFLTVPTVLNRLVKGFPLEKYNLRTLRFVNIGGSALIPEVGEEFESRTGVRVTQAYGLTETSPTTHANPLEKVKRESIGLPIADTFTRIVDPETGKDVKPGEPGELWIKGPQVMKGYYKNPEATAETLVDGWLRTGDVARVDSDGYTYIVDRVKELIKYKSYQVSPTELESILMSLDSVKDCAVVGKKDPDAGEIPVAFVVPAEGVDIDAGELARSVNERVAPFKKIRQVHFVSEIPRSPSGKILRRVLRETFFEK